MLQDDNSYQSPELINQFASVQRGLCLQNPLNPHAVSVLGIFEVHSLLSSYQRGCSMTQARESTREKVAPVKESNIPTSRNSKIQHQDDNTNFGHKTLGSLTLLFRRLFLKLGAKTLVVVV